MPTELKNIKVDFLSLVAKGANGKRIIYKSDGEGHQDGAESVERTSKSFLKSDERRMVFCPVYSPDEIDSQGEFAGRAEIEAAAYGFMKSRNVLNVDADHDFDPKAAFVAESWIVKGVDSLFPKEREGAWIVGIRVEDPELWARVKKGELEGVSMAGYAAKVRKSDNEGGGLLSKLEEMIGRLLKGEQHDRGTSADEDKTGDTSIEEFAAKIAKAVKDETEAGFSKRLDELAAKIELMEKSTPGRTSGGVDRGGESGESCGIA